MTLGQFIDVFKVFIAKDTIRKFKKYSTIRKIIFGTLNASDFFKIIIPTKLLNKKD